MYPGVKSSIKHADTDQSRDCATVKGDLENCLQRANSGLPLWFLLGPEGAPNLCMSAGFQSRNTFPINIIFSVLTSVLRIGWCIDCLQFLISASSRAPVV